MLPWPSLRLHLSLQGWVFNVVPWLLAIPASLFSGLLSDHLISQGECWGKLSWVTIASRISLPPPHPLASASASLKKGHHPVTVRLPKEWMQPGAEEPSVSFLVSSLVGRVGGSERILVNRLLDPLQ